jgi:hypothetical protein
MRLQMFLNSSLGTSSQLVALWGGVEDARLETQGSLEQLWMP